MPAETPVTGALAAALAKAQAAFPAIPRDKEVTVQTKAGGSYKFKYAPLDSILTAVRAPLSENGLAITQLLDSDPDGLPFLVTRLLHKDGGSIEGRTPIPHAEGETVQAFGSAITYLRRYALQALLGIAAEEDDDGNSASGNQATFRSERNLRVGAADGPDPTTNGGLIGTAEKTEKRTGDYALRQSPDGSFLGFRLKGEGRSGWLVEAYGPLADALAVIEADVIGKRVQVWGSFVPRNLSNGGKYQAFVLERISGPEFVLPAPGTEPETLPLGLDADEEAELDAAVQAA